MMVGGRQLGLRFLSGRLEGGFVPLSPGRALLIGRQAGADVLLADDLVSRRHARVTLDRDEVFIDDLGSTNGTYLNGTRVLRGKVEEGDRVLIGESMFTVVRRERRRAMSATAVRPLFEGADREERSAASAMQGRLEEVPLYDLLQLLATSRKSGVLMLRGSAGMAELRLDQGRVVGCSMPDHEEMSASKVLFRVFTWAAGQFELRPAPAGLLPRDALADSTDALLLEAARQLDEMRRLRTTLPVSFRVTGDVPEVALDEDDRALVTLVARHRTLDAVLDATGLPDVAAAERLASLHARGVIVEQPAPP